MTIEGQGRGNELLKGGARFAARPGVFSRLFAPSFHKLIDKMDRGLKYGALTAHLPDGTIRFLGGRLPGFEAEVRIRNWNALLRLAVGGSVGGYQGWEANEWSSPDLVVLFALFMANAESLGDIARAKGVSRWVSRFAHWLNRNTRAGAARNIHAHYDLGNDFYSLWLGQSMAYSSAIFASPSEEPNPDQRGNELDAAQLLKFRAMLDRVDAGNGTRLLEIGCGWGGLSHLAASRGAEVVAISLSGEQLDYARSTQSESGKEPAFLYRDYRDVDGCYDAIVSVEMVEALGREYWPDFMDCVVRSLKTGGKAAIQYISISDALFDGYAENVDFIQAYIFPGGMLIRTSEFRKLAEERGLAWRDQKDFGADYAKTLRCWRTAFDTVAANGLLPEGFDEKFVRLWRFYLMYCEGGFRGGGINVHQVTLIKE